MNPGSAHLNERGEAEMINVAAKQPTERTALAGCEVSMKPETFEFLRSGTLEKGDAFTVAKTAGILAAKRTAELIPLCHPLPLEHIEIRFVDKPYQSGVSIEAEVKTTAKTGVEMEALTAAAVAALTLYDMLKGHDPAILIGNLRLIKKTGGKSDYDDSSRNH